MTKPTASQVEKARTLIRSLINQEPFPHPEEASLVIAKAISDAVEEERGANIKIFTQSEQNWWQRKDIDKAIRARSDK